MNRFATLLTLLLIPGIALAQKDNGSTSASASGAPENDNLADAISITGNGEYLSTVTGATSEPGEATASCTDDTGQSVWWVFTPATSGPVTLDTNGSIQEPPGTQFTDTVLSIHTGSGHPLTQVACNDDDPGNPPGTGDFTSRIANFSAVAGTTYYVRVSSYPAGRADGEARLSFTGPTLVANEEAPEVQALSLSPAVPNPTAGQVEMTLSLNTPQMLDVAVFDVLGRRVLDVYAGAGADVLPLVIETSTLRSGTYVVRAMGEAATSVRSFTVAR